MNKTKLQHAMMMITGEATMQKTVAKNHSALPALKALAKRGNLTETNSENGLVNFSYRKAL